jgi:hypothetical protein
MNKEKRSFSGIRILGSILKTQRMKLSNTLVQRDFTKLREILGLVLTFISRGAQ